MGGQRDPQIIRDPLSPPASSPFPNSPERSFGVGQDPAGEGSVNPKTENSPQCSCCPHNSETPETLGVLEHSSGPPQNPVQHPTAPGTSPELLEPFKLLRRPPLTGLPRGLRDGTAQGGPPRGAETTKRLELRRVTVGGDGAPKRTRPPHGPPHSPSRPPHATNTCDAPGHNGAPQQARSDPAPRPTAPPPPHSSSIDAPQDHRSSKCRP
ncbi:basic proline-rich protein-like [Malurus melanocephalus]|uniref:basic proline-rich protein-like n=1 Tax=Malurus melanocephalus TaxID=175006 RepID=UPI0025487364|nr:basic proline-rich protein-like [Malurus melanocephalus]